MRKIDERPALKYVLMALLPLAVLLYTPIANYAILCFGERILLETLPVDPRDILRGDYVRLSYKIETIDDRFIPQTLLESKRPREESDVYVLLQPDAQGYAQVSGVVMERPPSNATYIRGKLRLGWGVQYECRYNLGVYYVPEGTGLELERAVRDGDVLADVRLLGGRGVIKRLEVLARE